ncbi:MAG: amidohydrolase family protein [Deltaproteobacteria bacterium]|nr:amidohydrolase family protein [Deltaproteobacteria bacterium]
MIIDFHTHIFPSVIRDNRDLFFHNEPDFQLLYQSPKSRLAGKGELLASMDRQGIRKSVIFGFPWKNTDHFRRHNDYIIESVQRHPDRFIGFCCADPLSKEAAREMERCLQAGLKGIGELALYATGFTPDIISSTADIMSISGEYHSPVLLHTNEPVGHQYPGKQPMHLAQLYNLIQTYRSNRIILAHWGGGLFFYALMKKEVKEILKNVWFDTAASPFLYTADIYRIAGEIIGYEKILFGSDYPLINPERYIQEMESAGIPSAGIEAMIGENARNLLDLS